MRSNTSKCVPSTNVLYCCYAESKGSVNYVTNNQVIKKFAHSKCFEVILHYTGGIVAVSLGTIHTCALTAASGAKC